MTVRTFDVLDWLRRTIQAHHDSPAKRGDGPLVMAAALPERERWTSLISEVLKTDDGVLVDATECGRGVACGNLEAEAPDLVVAIATLLEDYNADKGTNLRLAVEDGIAAVVGDQDYESVNAAQGALREVLAATCSDQLRSTDLTAFVYAADLLDSERATLVWQLLMTLPKLLGASGAATLAVIAGDGVVDFEVQCAGSPSLRDRLLDGGGVQTRHPWAVSRRPIVELKTHSRNRMPYVVLFLGAGASTADGLPTGDTLRNEALGRSVGRSVDRFNFETVASEWWQQLESSGDLSEGELGEGQEVFIRDLTLERVIAHEQLAENQVFSSTLIDFSERHQKVIDQLRIARLAGQLDSDPLRKMLLCQQRLVLVTVNFDHLIEARMDDEQIRPFVTEHHLEEFSTYLEEYGRVGGAIPLLKLHGDIASPATLVANIEQTRAGLSLARDNALGALIQRMEGQSVRPWWYVGYSMRDRDLSNTWNSSRVANFLEYWISPFMDPTVRRFIQEHRLRTWETAGLGVDVPRRHISLIARDFYELMEADLTSQWANPDRL